MPKNDNKNDTPPEPEKPLPRLLRQIALSQDYDADYTPEEAYLAQVLKSCRPSDRLEEMLLAQITVMHEAALHYLTVAQSGDRYMRREAGLRASIQFSRLMTDHVRTLRKCRATGKPA